MPMQFPGGPPPRYGAGMGVEALPPGTAPLPDHVLNPPPDFNERGFGRDNLLDLLSRAMSAPGQAMDAVSGMAAPYQDVAMGGVDPAGAYGMGGAQDFQPAPAMDMEPSVLEEIMAAAELAKRGMTEQAQQLYQRAMWRAQRMKEKPMVREGMRTAEDLAGRGQRAAEDAYGTVKGLFE